MSNETAKRSGSNLLSDKVNRMVHQIAKEANIKDYDLCVKEQLFSGDNYLGEIKRVRIKPMKSDAHKKTIHLIIKSAQLSTETRDKIPIAKFYANEVYIYVSVIPVVKRLQEEHGIPKEDRLTFATLCKYSLEDSDEMMIMKDLSSEGFQMRDKRKFIDFDHARLILKFMAKFHGASFVLQKKYPALFDDIAGKLPKKMEFGEGVENLLVGMAKATENFIDNPVHLEKLKKINANMVEMLKENYDSTRTEPYNVICHGDSWNNNFLFRYEEEKVKEVIFIDWQISRIGSPMTEVFHMLCLSLDMDLFDYRLEDLLEIYYDQLKQTMTKMGCDIETCYPRKIFDDHKKIGMQFGLCFGLCAIPLTLSEPSEAASLDETSKSLEGGKADIVINDAAAKRLNRLMDIFIRKQYI